MTIKQTNRQLSIGTPLGEDKLIISRMDGSERLSGLFQYDIVVHSEDGEINFDDLLGQNVTVRLEMAEDRTRYFNGFVTGLSQVEGRHRLATYNLTVHPWLWFLTRTADCRIFQEMNIPDIIKQVFRDQGFSDFDERLNREYKVWSYCVQYRESDFNFVSRLMEQEGIYYYFVHENGQHTLVLSDGIESHESVAGYEQVPYYPPENEDRRERDHINGWQHSQQVQPVEYALNDYEFEKPHTALHSKSRVDRSHQGANYQIYDYPGEYPRSEGQGELKSASAGDEYATVRLNELQCQYDQVKAKGDARGLSTGALFQLTDYARDDQNKEYLIVAAEYELANNEYESGDSEDEEAFYIELEAIDSRQVFAPPRVTPKPVVQGPQTAEVVGKSGEEIWTDEYGRVKVQFHWDRYSKADENSSCWIRVAQLWAGKQWGAMYIPRIGQEVIVEFLEGDPDRPIITGRVYNGSNKPPYSLPDEKTKSTIKSNSSKGGGGFNEIRLEDKAGEEQIFIHAELNKDVRVKNVSREWIGHDRHLVVKNDQVEKVEGNKDRIVEQDYRTSVKGNVFSTYAVDHISTIGGKQHLTVGSDRVTSIGSNEHLSVGSCYNMSTGSKFSITTGTSLDVTCGTSCAVNAGTTVHIKGGATVVIEGGVQLSLKASGSFVNIGPSGVDISGPIVNINSGGAAASGSGASSTSPGTAESPDEPEEAKEASSAEAGEVAESQAPQAPNKKTLSSQPTEVSPFAKSMKEAAEDGTPFCAQCEAARQQQSAGGGSGGDS